MHKDFVSNDIVSNIISKYCDLPSYISLMSTNKTFAKSLELSNEEWYSLWIQDFKHNNIEYDGFTDYRAKYIASTLVERYHLDNYNYRDLASFLSVPDILLSEIDTKIQDARRKPSRMYVSWMDDPFDIDSIERIRAEIKDLNSKGIMICTEFAIANHMEHILKKFTQGNYKLFVPTFSV